MRSVTFALISTVAVLCSAPVWADGRVQLDKPGVSCELKVRERYQYYDLDGATVCDLQKQIEELGTKWHDGKTYAAVTSWDLHYSYDVVNDKGRSYIKSVTTDVDIVYHLPRMTCTTSGLDLTQLWDKYLVNLKRHEFGHKDLAVKIAGELNETLVSMPTYASQRELDQEAKRRTDEKLQRLKEVQIEYDHETKHGATQGAVLAAN